MQAEYAQLKKKYADAVDHLFAVGYRVTDAEYKKLKNSVEEARAQWEIARGKLDEHKLAVPTRAN